MAGDTMLNRIQNNNSNCERQKAYNGNIWIV